MTNEQVVVEPEFKTFRVTSLQELNYIWPLIKEFHEVVKPKRYNLLDLEFKLTEELSQKQLGLFCVWHGDILVGYSLSYLAHIVMPMIFICQLYIIPEYRGTVSPMRKLYQYMESWAKTNGCRQVMLNTNNKDMMEMYTGMGFEIDSVQMYRELK